ncbi:SecDF P1 head subdomain-containing protein [Achromobacter arsenitoxydans]|uniref:SecDF P1 head subdomain-containing protein n=1 Tax=Achromobacter arsenitoxydans TaxID=1147684 RepID=UPI00111189F7|nr:hypothetical protein [Achromobacter arsenitoxydans]
MGDWSMRIGIAAAFATLVALAGCVKGEEEQALDSSPRHSVFLSIDTGKEEDASRLFSAIQNLRHERLDFSKTAFGYDPPTGFFFKAQGRCAALPQIAVRVQALITEILGKPPDCEDVPSPSLSPHGTETSQNKALSLHIESAKSSFDDHSGLPSMRIVLTADSAKDLASFTADHVGKAARLSVDNKTLIDPVILSPVSGPYFDLSGGMTHKEADNLSEYLTKDRSVLKIEILVSREK